MPAEPAEKLLGAVAEEQGPDHKPQDQKADRHDDHLPPALFPGPVVLCRHPGRERVDARAQPCIQGVDPSMQARFEPIDASVQAESEPVDPSTQRMDAREQGRPEQPDRRGQQADRRPRHRRHGRADCSIGL